MSARLILLLGAAASLAWGIHACISIPRFDAAGALAGIEIHGPVDSAVARDYLALGRTPDPLSGLRNHILSRSAPPSHEELETVARRYSTDAATLLFIETVSTLPQNRRLRDRYLAEMATVRELGIDRVRTAGVEGLVVLFVPGWFYVSHGAETGAHLGRQRALLDRLRVENELVAVNENGTVEENSRVVADAIRRRTAGGRRILVVSVSKAGAEVALALGQELSAHEARAVVAWLSIGGVVRGTPFADRALAPDLCWFVRLQLGLDGFDLSGVKSMRSAPGHHAFDSLTFPTDTLMVSYIAAPLSGNVSERASFGYGRLREHGPNDGLTLLADELLPGNLALVEPGVDHYFDHPDRDLWTVALFRVLLDWVSPSPRS